MGNTPTEENTATEEAMKKAIEDCSLVVKVLLNQPDMTENNKIKSALTFIREEATQLGVPPGLQDELVDAIYFSVIAPYILEQKCLNCRKNQPETSKGPPMQKEDKSVGGMFM